MSLAKRNEGAKVNSDINVTPMVDVMLVLLIIFMVITPMLQKGISVDLASKQSDTDARRGQRRRISSRSCETAKYSRQRPDRPDRLTNKVKDRLANRIDKTVYVKRRCARPLRVVVEVVDTVRAAGVDDLGLLTEQKKAGTPTHRQSLPAGGQ